jgi:hypothetical protein
MVGILLLPLDSYPRSPRTRFTSHKFVKVQFLTPRKLVKLGNATGKKMMTQKELENWGN